MLLRNATSNVLEDEATKGYKKNNSNKIVMASVKKNATCWSNREDSRKSKVHIEKNLKKVESTSSVEILSNKPLCKRSSVDTLASEVLANVTEENSDEESVGGNMDNSDDFNGTRDEEDVSQNSICYGNILCNCNSCKVLREKLLFFKPKPKNHGKFICSVCNKKFTRPCTLKLHEDSKCNTLKLFSCKYCAIGFTQNSTMKSHMRKYHTTNNIEKKTRISCDLCEKYFATKGSFIRHKRNIHFGFKYRCEICQKQFATQTDLLHHKTVVHADGKFECGHCSKIYNSKHKLREHIHSIHFQVLLKCGWPSCPETFTSAKGLKNHDKSSHTKSFDSCYFCETCGKRCRNKVVLQTHLAIHTGEKNYVCNVCGKNFRSDSNLLQHSRTHSNVRPFSCDHCPKAFRIKHHLRQHMAVHGMVHTSVRRKQRPS